MTNKTVVFKSSRGKGTAWIDSLGFIACDHAQGTCTTDNPIRYDDGRIAYDHPYRVPAYVKQLVRKAYAYRDQHKEDYPGRYTDA